MCCLLEQVPDASVSVEAPSVDEKKPKKSFGFGGIFKKPSVKAGLKVSVPFCVPAAAVQVELMVSGAFRDGIHGGNSLTVCGLKDGLHPRTKKPTSRMTRWGLCPLLTFSSLSRSW